MNIKKFAYATFVAAATVAFVIGSALPSEAAKKKKAAAAAPPAMQPATCFVTAPGPVCATKGGQKFTDHNSCYAMKDQASAARPGACKAASGGGGGKKMSKKKKA
jgi:hypothetical protein